MKRKTQLASEPRIIAMLARWKQKARYAIKNSEREKDPMGARLIHHGGVCTANCMLELEQVLREVKK